MSEMMKDPRKDLFLEVVDSIQKNGVIFDADVFESRESMFRKMPCGHISGFHPQSCINPECVTQKVHDE